MVEGVVNQAYEDDDQGDQGVGDALGAQLAGEGE